MDKNTSQFCARGVTTVMLLSVLSACGGSAATTPTVKPPTTTSATPTAVTPESTILAEMSARNTALLEKYTVLGFTNLADLSFPDGATYTGIVQGDLSNTDDNLTDEVIGEMTLSVTFSSTPTIFSGSATNFHDDKGAAMDGSLVFSGGEFDRSVDPNSDATLKMLSANGTLIDTNSRELVFASKFEGDFFGESVDAVGGAWLGDVTHGGKTQQITGTFIAEK